jgi:starch synthase
MIISHLSAECVPFAKTGGLGDVLGALPKALASRGHDTDIWIPFHLPAAEWYRKRHQWPEAATPPLSIDIMGQHYTVGILRGTLPRSGVPVYFVAHDPFFHRGHIYANNEHGADDGLWRFALFVRAVIKAMKWLGRKPQILHSHDWHPGLAPMLGAWSSWRDPWFDDVASVLTIHNMAHQGVYGSDLFPALGLPDETWSPAGVEFHGTVNLLKGAIMASDIVTTVSPTYAQEIQTPMGGAGLDSVLRLRSDRLVGILNGIDSEEWNPASDHYLPAHYTSWDLYGKAICRRELCLASGFDTEDPGLIIGVVGRLTHQKGFDVLLDAVWQLLDAGVRVVMLGSGEPALEEAMRHIDLWARRRFRAWVGYDERRAHLIEAGADAFLMPSRFEPCGLNQMYSLAYGTLPIVRRTGGLADTVIGYTGQNLEQANGFSFDDLNTASLLGTVRWAQQVFRTGTWYRLMHNAMRAYNSWARSALHYEDAYRRAREVRGLPW